MEVFRKSYLKYTKKKKYLEKHTSTQLTKYHPKKECKTDE